MTVPMTFDIVSDVVCPWCVIGIRGLEQALAAIGDAVAPTIRLHPFELNPDMPPGGQDIAEHIREKYGPSAGGGGEVRERIRALAADVGFTMAQARGARIYNTFDAHRLLHWAAQEGRQLPLKHALFVAYFTLGLDPSDPDVLVAAAGQAGLDPARASEIVAGDDYAVEVRADEARWRAEGITSVPTVIVNDRYLIQGGQPPAAFEKAIRRIAAEGQGESHSLLAEGLKWSVTPRPAVSPHPRHPAPTAHKRSPFPAAAARRGAGTARRRAISPI